MRYAYRECYSEAIGTIVPTTLIILRSKYCFIRALNSGFSFVMLDNQSYGHTIELWSPELSEGGS